MKKTLKTLLVIATIAVSQFLAPSAYAACLNAFDCADKFVGQMRKTKCENTGTYLNEKAGESVKSGAKIEKQAGKRGWTDSEIKDVVKNPQKTEKRRDTRWKGDGSRNDDPATMYVDKNGNYVVINDKTGDVVQVSDKNNSAWRKHDR